MGWDPTHVDHTLTDISSPYWLIAIFWILVYTLYLQRMERTVNAIEIVINFFYNQM